MREQPVRFENPDGRRLAGVIGRPDRGDARAVVVLCHGMLSGKNSPKHIALAERLAARGIATLRFDFTSRYESEGTVEEMTYTRQVADLEAAVRLARERLGRLPLGLYGSSMGGAVAILYAGSGAEVDAVATIAAVGRPGDLWAAWADGAGIEKWRREGWMMVEDARLPYGFYEDTLRQDVLGAAARVRAPILLVHGGRDRLVPVAQCRELHASAPGPKQILILPEADHRFSRPADLARMLDEVTDWFASRLLLPGTAPPAPPPGR